MAKGNMGQYRREPFTGFSIQPRQEATLDDTCDTEIYSYVQNSDYVPPVSLLLRSRHSMRSAQAQATFGARSSVGPARNPLPLCHCTGALALAYRL